MSNTFFRGGAKSFLGGLRPPAPPWLRACGYRIEPNAALRDIYHSTVTKREHSTTAKLLLSKSVFLSILTYGRESLVMAERELSQCKRQRWDCG